MGPYDAKQEAICPRAQSETPQRWIETTAAQPTPEKTARGSLKGSRSASPSAKRGAMQKIFSRVAYPEGDRKQRREAQDSARTPSPETARNKQQTPIHPVFTRLYGDYQARVARKAARTPSPEPIPTVSVQTPTQSTFDRLYADHHSRQVRIETKILDAEHEKELELQGMLRVGVGSVAATNVVDRLYDEDLYKRKERALTAQLEREKIEDDAKMEEYLKSQSVQPGVHNRLYEWGKQRDVKLQTARKQNAEDENKLMTSGSVHRHRQHRGSVIERLGERDVVSKAVRLKKLREEREKFEQQREEADNVHKGVVSSGKVFERLAETDVEKKIAKRRKAEEQQAQAVLRDHKTKVQSAKSRMINKENSRSIPAGETVFDRLAGREIEKKAERMRLLRKRTEEYDALSKRKASIAKYSPLAMCSRDLVKTM